MLPYLVRHRICPPCRYNHGDWAARRLVYGNNHSQQLRCFSSATTCLLRQPSASSPKQTKSSSPNKPKHVVLITLSNKTKEELTVFEHLRTKLLEKAQEIANESPSSADAPTLEGTLSRIKRTSGPNSGFGQAASKLRAAYPGNTLQEVDLELGIIMRFKKGSHLMTKRRQEILAKLGLWDEPDHSQLPRPVPPVAQQESLRIDTQPDFLNHKPQALLIDHGGVGGSNQSQVAGPKVSDTKPNDTKPNEKEKPDKSQTTKGDEKPAKGTLIASMVGNRVQTASPEDYPLVALTMDTVEVPKLSHDLSRVLFNPGVYQLQDPRSRVWNFDPYLGNLMPVSEFNYDALNKYITSSEDVHLRDVALSRGKRYVGSTSSMSGVLAHFHFLLSAFRLLNLTNVSRGFDNAGQASFTRIQKGPTAIFLRHKDGVYAVDADKEFDSANILMSLGRSMEKLLTSDKEEFERYRRTRDAEKDAQLKSTQPEAYHYSGLGQFLLRSQLDAHDPRLPGTGMFDLKTRAVAAVRMMVLNHEQGVGYQIKDRFGSWESYEREYFDMMRSAFLKYSLQVRMGRMDGIFVAYHNTERLFGFQYVPLPEMDLALHGQSDAILGDREFSLSLQMLNYIFNEATMQYPGQSLRFHFETREASTASPQYMYVFAEPVTDEEIKTIQGAKKGEIRAFEERIFNPDRAKPPVLNEDEHARAADTPTADISAHSAETGPRPSNAADLEFLDSILGMDLNAAMNAETKEDTAAQSEVSTQQQATPDDAASSVTKTSVPATQAEVQKPLSAWRLNIRNMVNGVPVVRPENLKGSDTWGVQYTLSPMSESEGRRHYILCKNRRKGSLEAPQDTDSAADFYLRRLISMSRQGAHWRKQMDRLDAQKEPVVLYQE